MRKTGGGQMQYNDRPLVACHEVIESYFDFGLINNPTPDQPKAGHYIVAIRPGGINSG